MIKILMIIAIITSMASANIKMFGNIVYSSKYTYKVKKIDVASVLGIKKYRVAKKHKKARVVKKYRKHKKHKIVRKHKKYRLAKKHKGYKKYRKHLKHRVVRKHKKYKKRYTKKHYHFPKGGIRVKISAYTSHRNQCDSTPFITAISYKLNRYDKRRVVAVSHDLFRKLKGKMVALRFYQNHKLRTVRVRVVDLMNHRYRRTVDLYYYRDIRGARHFGRRHGRLIVLPKHTYAKIPSYKIYKWKRYKKRRHRRARRV